MIFVRSRFLTGCLLLIILLVGAAVFLAGIDWGLPSSESAEFLYGGEPPWPGERVAELKPADDLKETSLGADVDQNPQDAASDWSELTAADADRAELLARYLLYSHQPDEMITFRSIASMSPGEWDFNPRLFQYGGLFIYPVAALLKACDALNWIEAKPDLSYYYENPEAFAKFYLVARGYVVAFALFGVLATYQLGRGLGGRAAGLMAAAIYVCMPAVINMAHEAKPHLPAAVLMMYAVLASFAYIKRPTDRRYFFVVFLCGLAASMVVSAAPIVVLIGLVLVLDGRSFWDQWWRFTWGVGLVIIIFFAINPYWLLGLVRGDAAFASNMSNTWSMYDVGRFQLGLLTVAGSLAAAMGPLAAVGGVLLGPTTVRSSNVRRCILLGVPVVLLLAVLVAVGAGKPGEYGRFMVFPAVALSLPVAVFLRRQLRQRQHGALATLLLVLFATALWGEQYVAAFWKDRGASGTRREAAAYLAERLTENPEAVVGVRRVPAPYCVPPLDFARRRVVLLDESIDLQSVRPTPDLIVVTGDDEPPIGHREGRYVVVEVFPKRSDFSRALHPEITWAAKPVWIFEKRMPLRRRACLGSRHGRGIEQHFLDVRT